MANALVRSSGSVREAVREFFDAERRNSDRIRRAELGLGEDDDLPPYIQLDYPKAMYPPVPEEEPITVQTAAEERRKLAEGYLSTYAEAEAAWRAPEPEETEAEEEPETVEVGAEPKRGRGRPRKF